MIELHELSHILSPDIFRSVFRPLLKKIDSLFVCVHAHPNNCCGDFRVPGTELNLPQVHELTFLRRDRLNARGKQEGYPPLIPHPLDITRNVQEIAPLFLSEGWTGGRRLPEARIKMLEDELEFEKYQNIERDYSNRVARSIYTMFQQLSRNIIVNHPHDNNRSATTRCSCRKVVRPDQRLSGLAAEWDGKSDRWIFLSHRVRHE